MSRENSRPPESLVRYRTPAEPNVESELVTPESEAALAEIRHLLEARYGEIDVAKLRASAEKAAGEGVRFDWQSSSVKGRLMDELSMLLGTVPRPRQEQPRVLVGIDPEQKKRPARPGDAEALKRIERSMKSALAQSIPRKRSVQEIRNFIEFAREKGNSFDVSDSEIKNWFEQALSNRRFNGSALEFIGLASELGVEFRLIVEKYALEHALTSVFDRFGGMKEEDLEEAEEIMVRAKQRGLSLELNEHDSLFQRALVKAIAAPLTKYGFDWAERLLQFCHSNAITVDTTLRDSAYGSITEIMEDKLRKVAQNDLDLESFNSLIEFCTKNKISFSFFTPEMIKKYRADIPQWVENKRRREEAQSKGFRPPPPPSRRR